MLRKFLYWMKTGEAPEAASRILVDEPEPEETEESPFIIQVKENLLPSYPYERWKWRLLNPEGRRIENRSVYTQGTEGTKKEATKRAEGAIKQIALHKRNEEQEWEDVNG